MMFWGNFNYNFQEAAMGWVPIQILNWVFIARGLEQPHLVAYMESHDEERLMYKNTIWKCIRYL